MDLGEISIKNVGRLFMKILSKLCKGYLPSGLNSSYVVLLPKKDKVVNATDFRPIALANFLFKIISKTLASRLGSVVTKIISPNQFCFISGRSIHDCVVLGSEGINRLNR